MNSQIILAKGINVDKQYTNVLSYSESDMLNLCRENQVANANNYSFLRPTGTILVDFPYDVCLQANYIAFQNPDYSNKWFFAWIDDVVYKGDRNCELRFTIDAWSTWWDKWTRKMCYVIREHTNDDTIGNNLVPENIDVGDVIEEYETEDSSYSNSKYWVAVASDWKIKNGSSDSDSDKGSQFAGITVYNNTVFGNQLFLIKVVQYTDLANLALLILRTNKDAHIADIKNIFIIPDVAINESLLTSNTASVGGQSFTFYTMPNTRTPATFNTTIMKRTSFTGLTVKNNKCFCYPYNYLLVTNNQGSNNIYRYEDFSTANCIFENQFAISIGGSGRVVPKNYKGMSVNDDEALPLGKYPTCGWSSDAYINWLTQNSVNMPMQIVNSVISAVTPPTETKSSTVGSMTAEKTVSIANSVAGIIGQFRTASLLPNISGGQATGDIIWSKDRNCFTFREMRAKNEFMKIIDDYFTRFGYATKRLKSPNITGRRYWNYIEISASDEIGTGDVPVKYMDIINNACRRGVTIWHDHEHLGDYSLSNTIVS